MSSALGHVDYPNMSDEEWGTQKTNYFNSIKNIDNLINTKVIKNGKYNRKERSTFCTEFRLK